MKSTVVLFLFYTLFVGCKTNYKLLKNTEATIVYGFEFVDLGNAQKEYFLKSASCVISDGVYDLSKGVYTQKPEWYDLLGILPKRNILTSELVNKLSKKYKTDCEKNAPETTKFFSKKLGETGVHYSDFIYNYYLQEEEIYIIFKVKGDIALVKKVSDKALLDYNKKYSCPIFYDSLNLPFCKVIRLKESFSPSESWLNKNGYYKMSIDSFKINLCD
jgi:hypothetical protein